MRARARSVVLATAVLLAACSGGPVAPEPAGRTAVVAGPVGDGATGLAPAPSITAPTASAPPSPTAPTTTVPPTTTTAVPPTADELAGLLSHEVPQAGTGDLVVVPGSEPAPGPGADQLTVSVSVEGGLPADGAAFAAFVLATLNDPRGWPHEGYTFARTDDTAAADVTVVLASPATSERLCRPLITYGTLSCRTGDRSVLTFYRWVEGIPEYAADLTAYRRYLVNHEVGHFLGKGHVACPGAGARAPVMMQQTKGLQGCAPNSWPYP